MQFLTQIRNRRPALALTSMALAGALVLTACGGDGGNNDEPSSKELTKSDIFTQGWVGEQSDADPVAGGTLSFAEYGEARSFDTTKTYATGATGGNVLAALYDTLMRYDRDADAWVPQLAESLESNDDQTVWTLKLREGVTFSDGTPVDAKAVVGSLGYYMANYGYGSITMLTNGAKMKPIDDLTVEFTVARPWATFPAMLSGGPGMIMAPAAYKDPANFKPIGAGAFELEKYTPQSETLLKARPDYYGGAPNLEKLRFVTLGADSAKVESLENGDVNGAWIRTDNVVEKAREDGHEGYVYVYGSGVMININGREGRPGEDIRVRQALAMAFDNQSYVDRAKEGAGIASKSLFADSSPWSTGVETPDVDVEAAKALLDEAKADGYDGKIGYLVASDPAAQAAGVQVEAQLEAVGFDVTLDVAESITDLVQRAYVDHDFDLTQGASNVPDEDPFGALYEWLYSQSPTNGGGYANEEVDKLLGELQAVGDDPEAGAEVMKKIETIFQEEVPSIIVGPNAVFVVLDDNTNGVIPTTQGIQFFDEAWIAK
ncbi:MAG: ABC transporter substrate-binding protein [Nocardioides sp.]|uniref:ABC transporter substrate-binding protein n=1 Tax=Nocardioides sp. TaxID=35761 RepID=UPI003EFC2C83